MPRCSARNWSNTKRRHRLVNTGWTGGPYGVGHRIPIRYTRAMIRAALKSAAEGVPYRTDPIFGLEVPTRVPDVPDDLLNPRDTAGDQHLRCAGAHARRTVAGTSGTSGSQHGRLKEKEGGSERRAKPATPKEGR